MRENPTAKTNKNSALSAFSAVFFQTINRGGRSRGCAQKERATARAALPDASEEADYIRASTSSVVTLALAATPKGVVSLMAWYTSFSSMF